VERRKGDAGKEQKAIGSSSFLKCKGSRLNDKTLDVACALLFTESALATAMNISEDRWIACLSHNRRLVLLRFSWGHTATGSELRDLEIVSAHAALDAICFCVREQDYHARGQSWDSL